jgi:hypothetical protein
VACIVLLAWYGRPLDCGAEIAPLVNQERARETHPPLTGSSKRISACDNSRSLVGYDGGDAAWYSVASQRDQFPEGTYPGAVEFEVRRLILSAS